MGRQHDSCGQRSSFAGASARQLFMQGKRAGSPSDRRLELQEDRAAYYGLKKKARTEIHGQKCTINLNTAANMYLSVERWGQPPKPGQDLSLAGPGGSAWQQLDSWAEQRPQQAGQEHAGRQRRDTQEAGRQQQLGWQEAGAQQEEAGAQQAGLHTGRQRRDTEEDGLQQEVLQQGGWQLDCWQHEEEDSEQVGTQHTGLQQTGTQHTGLQQMGTQQACWQGEEVQQAGWQLDCWQHEEEDSEQVGTQQTGLQQTGTQQACWQGEEVQQAGWQLDCWQHEEEDSEQVGTQQTGLQQTGLQQMDLQQTGTQQACRHREEVQQAGWQLDCWQHEGVQELLQPDWQGLSSQLTGAQTRARRGAGAQQLGVQQGGSQKLSWQLSTCLEEPVQVLGEETRLTQLRSLEQTDVVDAAITYVLVQQVSAMVGAGLGGVSVGVRCLTSLPFPCCG
ncbi:hypothetical protein P7K49_032424 [Saguinus oedipus]|uniref:Uncharacterized protein n=1 Tax=Saguinus oedipus TaxID=9490 RepID=A0ABQ9TY76_SAGOE|nr:hypothetical protein P7K49_032424 [Saguinus oedipus]